MLEHRQAVQEDPPAGLLRLPGQVRLHRFGLLLHRFSDPQRHAPHRRPSPAQRGRPQEIGQAVLAVECDDLLPVRLHRYDKCDWLCVKLEVSQQGDQNTREQVQLGGKED